MRTENEIRNLTGVRAFAAFWVVIFHWRLIDGLDGVHFLHHNPVIGRGYWAVDLFFVLSGFIIATVYHQRMAEAPTLRTYQHYLLLRLARLYPIHFVIFLGYLPLLAAASLAGSPMTGPDTFTLEQAIAHLTLTQSWHWADGLSWNWPSWSISAEFFAYAFLFPLYCWLFRRLPMGAMLALLALTWGAACLYGQWSGHGFKTYHSGLFRITAEFLAGYMLFFWSRSRTLSPRQANGLFCGSLFFLLALCFLPEWTEVFVLAPLCGLIFSLYYGSFLLNRVFGNSAIVYLGHISYAVYMVHNLMNISLDRALKMAGASIPLPPLQAGAFMIALSILTLCAAAVCFHVIEDPARNWMKRRLKRSAASPAKTEGERQRLNPQLTVPVGVLFASCCYGLYPLF
jgi:peptidoglycan/LPS O-acetylase OafA/YrhL